MRLTKFYGPPQNLKILNTFLSPNLKLTERILWRTEFCPPQLINYSSPLVSTSLSLSLVIRIMLPFFLKCCMLIDNIFVQFGGRLFRQVIGIPMGTNCAPLLADLFLYSYENEFLDNMIRSGHRRLARSFNLSYRYTDDLFLITRSFWIISKRYIHPS